MSRPVEAPPTRLLDRVRWALRLRHYSRRTEKAYVHWVRRYILFHGKRHPKTLGAREVTEFLSALANQRKVSASTQTQALSALLFLYEWVLEQKVEWLADLVRARRPTRLPLVLARDEVKRLLARLRGVPWLVASLLYGSGLRLSEALKLRIKDLSLERREIMVRDGKGRHDRVTMLPLGLLSALRQHMEDVQEQHRRDIERGAGFVDLPDALVRKYPNAPREWTWQWLFPAARTYRVPGTGERRRHHVHETVIQRAVRQATATQRSPSPSPPTPSATPSPRTYSNPATTSAPSRSCSGTRT